MLEAGERNDAQRSRPPEGVALAALALALVGISFLALARARVDLRDEGYLWYGAIAASTLVQSSSVNGVSRGA